MATKRFVEDSGHTEPDQSNGKRLRPTRLASVIGDVVAANCLQNLFLGLEPMLRKVVHEEIENGLRRGTRSLSRSSSIRIQAPEQSNLQLTFGKKLSLPIFTGSKIFDADSSPLQILLRDKSGGGDQVVLTSLPFPLKIEIVVLDGDFPETCTSEEFNKKIVKERTGKRRLLTGDLNVIMKDGFAPVGEIEFTDNSSLIRSRRFRNGARVVKGSGNNTVHVHEAITESFMVKDNRGESSHYEKPSCCFGERRNNGLPLRLLWKPAFQSWSTSIYSYMYRFLSFLITFTMMPLVVLGKRDTGRVSEPSLDESLDVLYVFLGLAVAIFGSVGIYFLWKKYSQRPRLVSSDVFNTYPIHVFVGSSQVVECFICTEAYVLGDIICTIPCGHAFHVHHIREWLTKRAPTCPTCYVSHT